MLGIWEERQWINRVIPLPKEIQVQGSMALSSDRIAVECNVEVSPHISTAIELLSSFSKGTGESAELTIYMSLVGNGDVRMPRQIRDRLPFLPNCDQAYAIFALQEKGKVKKVQLVANTVQGLLYAARTMSQLVQPSAILDSEDKIIIIPLISIIDWPDIGERGQWGHVIEKDPDYIAWTSQWKMNTLDASSSFTSSDNKNIVFCMNEELMSRGRELGVQIVPFITHLEQISRHMSKDLLDEVASVPDPSKPLRSDYSPGLCMSSSVTQELIAKWLYSLAKLEDVKNVLVWLSEDCSQCFCEQCNGKEPYELEVKCLIQSFQSVKNMIDKDINLRILLTQGSYSVNEKILALVPTDVGVVYYDGGRTYDSSHNPMIYPPLEKYSRDGNWLGVYPQITHSWRTVFPWTAPQFISYRAKEFKEKCLNNVTGYAVPSNEFHEFNVMAMAEWLWNASGRSPMEFCEAYACKTRVCEPELFSKWAMKVGEAGWALSESNFFLRLIYDPELGLVADVPPDHRFEYAEIRRIEELEQCIDMAEEALLLAKKSENVTMVFESECLLFGLKAYKSLNSILDYIHLSSVNESERSRLENELCHLDRYAYSLRYSLLEWGEYICSKSNMRIPLRLMDTANVLLRTCDALWQKASGQFGITDSLSGFRLKALGKWSSDDFFGGQHTVLTFDLSEIVSEDGGNFQIGFDFITSHYGTNIEDVKVVNEDGYTIAQTHDALKTVSIYDRWAEIRLCIPPVEQGFRLSLLVGLCGPPADARAERRTCSGKIGIRRIYKVCDNV